MPDILIITGASRGIGLATAKLALSQGAQVFNLSRSASPDERITDLATDFSDPTWQHGLESRLADCLPEKGRISLVHNAGRLINDAMPTVDAGNFRAVMEINVVAPLMLTQLVLPRMASESSVLYVGSTLGEKAVPGACTYVTSKHALIGLMRATCQDLSGSGIHTACVCPGFTDTEMLRGHVGDDQSVLESIASGVTFGRLIEPEEIARTLWFCAGNPVINGAVIHANLGQIER